LPLGDQETGNTGKIGLGLPKMFWNIEDFAAFLGL